MTNIALYSGQHILAAGLRSLIAGLDEFTLSAVCGNLSALGDHVRDAGCPKVLLIDVTPETTLAGLNQLKDAAKGASIILWIDGVSTEFVAQAIEAGVRGILPRSASIEDYVACFQCVAGGGLWVEASLRNKLLSARRTNLAPRERELMALVAQGLKNKEIAWKMGITEGTVKVYLSHLFTKVGASDRFGLALLALKNLAPDSRNDLDRVADASTNGAFVMPTFLSYDQPPATIQ